MTDYTHFIRAQNYIDGRWVDATGGATIDVTNPADGSLITSVPSLGADQTRQAIAAAKTALPAWRSLVAEERARYLRRFHDAILDNQRALAELLTREQGKPLKEAMGEVGMSAAYILWFAEEARRVYGDIIPSPWAGRQILVTKEPVGVVGAITPWNFPSSMLARKIGPALAAGCTVVAKPAAQTPLSSLAFGVLADEIGLPAGVLNILTGDAKAIGGELTSSPDVAKISFTGSTAVGKLLLRQGADTVKTMSMELGGNAPFIVLDDADLDRAVAGAIAAKFRNAGQTCVCTNRFYVQDGIYDAFMDKFAAATAALRIGDGLDEGTEIGPLVDDAAVAKVEALLADATEQGAKITLGGKRHGSTGHYFEPTILSGALPGMRLAQEEIFGPVAPIFRFATEDEAIALANDTDYGLAGYFYTKDLARAFRVANRLEVGIVGINEGLVTTEVAPFGGVKQSGLGREGSKYGIEDYMHIKYICVGGLNG
jgi:succinate-semialdehyde dehydrogenase/glutarate-semialdehyde dehydrogenase